MSVDDEAVSVEVRDKMKRVRERLDNGAALKDSRRRVADWQAHWRATTLAAVSRLCSSNLSGAACREARRATASEPPRFD